MQLGEVDSDIGQLQQVLNLFTVWILDWDLWIKSSEDDLIQIMWNEKETRMIESMTKINMNYQH